METEHLDERTLAGFLGAPQEHEALRAHLIGGCAACDEFLATHEVAGLEGHVDALLLAAAPSSEPKLDEVGWKRLRRELRPRRRRLPMAVGLSMAAALAVFFFLPRAAVAPPDTEVGVKGPASALQLELSAAVRGPDGAVTRIDDGATVPQAGTIILRYHSNALTPATLWLVKNGAPARRLGEVQLEAGTHELSSAGVLVGVSLAGEVGNVELVVVPGGGPSSPAPGPLGVESASPRAAGRISLHVAP